MNARAFALAALLLACTVPARAAEHPDYSGTWKLDLKASDSVDDLLKAQGKSWVERTAARNMAVIQVIRQSGDTLGIAVHTSVKDRDDTLRIGGGWEEKDSDDSGKVRSRTDWDPDGTTLVTRTAMTLKDGVPAEFIVRRTLPDPKTLLQVIELRFDDGRTLTARRVLRRVE